MAELGVTEADFKENFIRGSGPGGQKRNKTSSGVRLTHAPTGLEVRVTNSRSQGLNRFLARRLILERLQEMQNGSSLQQEKREKLRKQKDRRRRRTKQADNGNS